MADAVAEKKARTCNDWPKLTEEEIAERLAQLPTWTLIKDGDINKLERRFVTKNFQAALDFINGAGAVAERRNHHPDLSITGYNNVHVVVFSHGLSGLTDNDIELCKEIDAEVKIVYSQKWLRENPLSGSS